MQSQNQNPGQDLVIIFSTLFSAAASLCLAALIIFSRRGIEPGSGFCPGARSRAGARNHPVKPGFHFARSDAARHFPGRERQPVFSEPVAVAAWPFLAAQIPGKKFNCSLFKQAPQSLLSEAIDFASDASASANPFASCSPENLERSTVPERIAISPAMRRSR